MSLGLAFFLAGSPPARAGLDDMPPGRGVPAGLVVMGAGIAALLPEPSLWQVISAFLAPAGLAFLVHWWNAQER